jgi:predicted secreted protein
MSRWTAVMSLVLALLLVACSGLTRPPKVITEQDNGKTIEVTTGDAVDIVVESSPSTGYLWQYTNANLEVIMQIRDPEFKADSSLLGAEGRVTFHFKAARDGQKVVRMIYHKPDQPENQPAKVLEFTIVVK